MNCFEIQEKIIDLVIGELTPEDERLIREHIKECPICREELEFINSCLQTCTLEDDETCECYYQETYWNDFVVDMHEKISHEKPETRFPFEVIIPIAASAALVGVLAYFIFIRPSQEQTAQDNEIPSYYQYDPYDEMDKLSPEETEEFIKMINQKYNE
jgi:hypothetical protein